MNGRGLMRDEEPRGMSIWRRSALALVSVAACSLLLAGTASANFIYQGSDFSRHNSNWTQTGACDLEADGHGFYSNFESWQGNRGTVWDGNGSRTGCGWSGTYPSGILWHNACEDRAGGDICTPGIIE